MRQLMGDRVGIGWRRELAAGILSHLDEIDVVEVLLEDHLDASRRTANSLQFLSRQVPVIYHGVSLGLATAHPVDRRRLERIARTANTLAVEAWSEHLAFVRAGGIEIGHLAAPPRSEATIEGTLRNLRRVHQTVGIMPALENIATLIEPPGSTMSEPAWIGAIARETAAPLLIDLHNLFCNARNAALDPREQLMNLPLRAATTVHLSGGRSIPEPAPFAQPAGATRLLDDHLHPVPPPVFELLTMLAARVPGPLTVIIERDGNYPPFDSLLAELRCARAALSRGRARRERQFDECA